jgi:hypothetical protein
VWIVDPAAYTMAVTELRTTNPRIERALDVVEDERALLEAERAAFARFLDRLSAVEPQVTAVPLGQEPQAPHVTQNSSRASVADRIESAYRDTVMSTRHYASEYGETFEVNLRSEFGTELACALTDSRAVSAVLLRTLRDRTRTSIRQREEFAQVVEREQDSLLAIDGELSRIEADLYEVGRSSTDSTGHDPSHRDTERLGDLEDACDELADRRQETLHSQLSAQLLGLDGVNLMTYLYGECDFTCPALADVLAVLESVRRYQRRVRHRSLAQ